VNNTFRVATSTDNPAVPDTENGNRVELLRAPATGLGFTAADAADGTTVTATTPAATTAPTATTDENTRERLVKPITALAFRKERTGNDNDRSTAKKHRVPGTAPAGPGRGPVQPRNPPPDQRTVASLATTTKTTTASMNPGT